MTNRAIDDYCILRADNQVQLSMVVKDFILQGWQPVGSHVVVMDQTGNFTRAEYSQTMVKYERE